MNIIAETKNFPILEKTLTFKEVHLIKTENNLFVNINHNNEILLFLTEINEGKYKECICGSKKTKVILAGGSDELKKIKYCEECKITQVYNVFMDENNNAILNYKNVKIEDDILDLIKTTWIYENDNVYIQTKEE